MILSKIKFTLLFIFIVAQFYVLSGPTVAFAQESFTDKIKSFFNPDSNFQPQVKGYTSAKGKHRTKLTKVVFGYFPYWVEDNTYIDWEALSHISYFSSVATTSGTLNHRGWPKPALVATAHEHDVKFLLTITNFSPAELDTILGNPTVRNKLIVNIVNEMDRTKIDGVSIDFETPNTSQAGNFNKFFADLKTALKSKNPNAELHIATWPVDWEPPNYDYKTVSDIADGIFIMAYNYHYAGSPVAGPVTTLEGPVWGQYNLRWTIDDYLKNKVNGKKSKVILGFPYYGLDWPTANGNVPGNATATAKAYNYTVAKDLALRYGRKWDSQSKNPYVVYKDGSTTRQLWYDDSESLSYKYKAALDSDLGGVGIWALGFDSGTLDLWNTIRKYFSIPVSDINTDRKVDITDINSLLTSLSKFDAKADINSDQEINGMDFSFVLSQWGSYPLPELK